MKQLWQAENWLSGLEWLFFIFVNIVIIPMTIGEAFDLSSDVILTMLQLSFIVTGIACLLQVFVGHGRPIMEGQSGLWWGIILTLVLTASSQGMKLTELGGSLTIGIFISAILTIIIGLCGFGPYLAKLFTPGVMGVFMFLFGCTLIQIFMKGMMGLPFGNPGEGDKIHLSITLLSVVIAGIVIVISVATPPTVRRYTLLIGMIGGWIAFFFIFGGKGSGEQTSLQFELFPLGAPVWNTGIIITAVLTGLLNTANTFGALKGTETIFSEKTTKKEYRFSFTITGVFASISGLLGLVPYAPFVSTIGFLKQTNILKKLPFILGAAMLFVMGIIPLIGRFFSTLPLSVGSAVLFVSYLQLLNSSRDFFKEITWNTLTIYRAAIPLFAGIIIMTFPASYFESIPDVIRPLISNGLLVGIILSLLLENLIPWDAIGDRAEETTSD